MSGSLWDTDVPTVRYQWTVTVMFLPVDETRAIKTPSLVDTTTNRKTQRYSQVSLSATIYSLAEYDDHLSPRSPPTLCLACTLFCSRFVFCPSHAIEMHAPQQDSSHMDDGFCVTVSISILYRYRYVMDSVSLSAFRYCTGMSWILCQHFDIFTPNSLNT